MLSGPMGPVPMKVGIYREPGLGEDPGMEEPLLPTKMGSVTATELGRALGESIKEGSGPEAKMSPCSMTRASLKESLHAIKESVKQGLGTEKQGSGAVRQSISAKQVQNGEGRKRVWIAQARADRVSCGKWPSVA